MFLFLFVFLTETFKINTPLYRLLKRLRICPDFSFRWWTKHIYMPGLLKPLGNVRKGTIFRKAGGAGRHGGRDCQSKE